VTGEHDLVEARCVHVAGDSVGARRECHILERERVPSATRQIDRECGAVDTGEHQIPASTVDASTVDEDDRQHRSEVEAGGA
jgi:hypothetical protein